MDFGSFMILPKYPRTGMARGKVTFANNLAKLCAYW
jgi:hypothetical protein